MKSDEPLWIAKGVEISPPEITAEYSRSGGPGGQHVNKTETKVALRFALVDSPSIPQTLKDRLVSRLAHRITKSGELLVTCSASRERSQNEETALLRLLALLREAAIPDRLRKKTRPSRGSKFRRLSDKKKAADKKKNRRAPRADD